MIFIAVDIRDENISYELKWQWLKHIKLKQRIDLVFKKFKLKKAL